MLNFLCIFVLFNAVKTDTKLTFHHMGKTFILSTYHNKIENLEGCIFKKYFTIKRNWDGLPVFTQETIYHVRTEMRQSLVACFRTGNKLRGDLGEKVSLQTQTSPYFQLREKYRKYRQR